MGWVLVEVPQIEFAEQQQEHSAKHRVSIERNDEQRSTYANISP